ncbi:hypothetical protein IAR50_007144 [Cryptococcus sp. DSM 104548]
MLSPPLSPGPDDTILLADDELQSDGEDDIPVFFGAHRPEERLLQTLARPSQRQQIHPNDSLRRKSLLLSTEKRRHNHGALTDRDYARLYRSTLSDDSDSCATSVGSRGPSTPVRGEQDPSNLTFEFESLHLSAHDEPRDQEDSDSPSEGSDKENVPVPSPIHDAPLPVEMSFEKLSYDSGRQDSLDLNDEDESIPELDMGGLKLSDFADGDIGVTYDHIEDFDACSDEPQQESPSREERILQSLSTPPFSTPGQQVPEFDDQSSPLEIARAGPVAIPVLSSHHFTSIRADVSSPCRNLPPSPIARPALTPKEATPAIRLASVESPPRLVSPAVPMTPSHTSTVPPADLVQRGAKALQGGAGGKSKIKSQPADHKQSAALKMVIKSQLDSALIPRVAAPRVGTVGSSGLTFSSAPSGPSRNAATGTNSLPKTSETPKSLPERLPNLEHRPQPRPVKRPLLKFSSASAPAGSAIPRPALTSKSSLPRPKSALPTKNSSMLPPPSSIPLKRPAVSQPLAPLPSTMAPPRSALSQPTVNHTRPTLGQPARAFQSLGTPLRAAPLFSIGIGGENVAMPRVGMKSPAKSNMLLKKRLTGGETPRKLGTPMRFGTPRQQPSGLVPLAASVTCTASLPTTGPTMTIVASSPTRRSPPKRSITETEPVSQGPPAASTRHASENPDNLAKQTSPPSAASSSSMSGTIRVASPRTSRASSPSPPRPAARRTKRASVAKTPVAKTSKATSKPPQSTPGVPALTEKQLKTTTARNTARNQVYHCAIDRQVIRQAGPRPPSPTSKIRTTSDRVEEDRKNAREVRARRRKGEPEEENKPVLERIEVLKAPGDDEEYRSPSRPAKRSRTSTGSSCSGSKKRIRWDREILVIHDDGSGKQSPSEEPPVDARTGKSCIKTKMPLDEHGNVIDAQRPVDDLKRTRVVVTAVFYDGEEPVPAPASATRSRKK